MRNDFYDAEDAMMFDMLWKSDGNAYIAHDWIADRNRFREKEDQKEKELGQ